MTGERRFLFSVDLEEFSAAGGRRDFRRTPLPVLTERYLAFLRRAGMRATFFVVGEIAREFPDLIRAIAAEGHELGCHTDTHLPLNEHTPDSLRDDLRRNLDALLPYARGPVQGFRAPILSLTARTRWAYEILAELGFTYSSSVLPARNPLYGWPEFGQEPQVIDGVVELPVTLASLGGGVRLPVGAGTYFRCLPFWVTRRSLRKLLREGKPVVGYFHPYDCDPEQEWVMNQGVGGNRLLNWLLYWNRSQTMKRLDFVAADGFKIIPYHEHLAPHLATRS